MYPKAEILFPPSLISSLRNLREQGWADLVDRVSKLSEIDLDTLAFCLLMIRINSCLKCYSGSYKFMRGCEACAMQSITQFKGDETDLLQLYAHAQADIQNYLDGNGPPDESEIIIESHPEDELADEEFYI
ncbi:MAG: hypothetical protein GXP37_13535 [Chloroflexi bacterium]|nr:hypothetical protein [Chloroflexota bacterium]